MIMRNEPSDGLLEALDGIWYVVDRDLTIQRVSRDNWNASVVRCSLPEGFKADRIIGRNILDFISGDQTKSVYRALCDRVFSGQQEKISFVYNCDTPELRRDIRMTIQPWRRGAAIIGVVFHNVEVATVQRPSVDLLLNNVSEDGTLDALLICSFCKNVRHPINRDFSTWMTAEDYYRRGGKSDVLLSHGICDRCEEKFVAPNGSRR
jgi:hypothetical protein